MIFKLIRQLVAATNSMALPYYQTELCPADLREKLKEKLSSSNYKKINLNNSLAKARFVIFDLETTGFNWCKGDKIISIGAVIYENGKVTDCFHRLINPKRNIPEEITNLTNITNEMVQDSGTFCQAFLDFLDFIGENSVLVAHNTDFDIGFINAELRQIKTKFCPPTIDTLKLSNSLYPKLKNYSLDHLLCQFNIPAEGRHDALGDAVLTSHLFAILLTELQKIKIQSVNQLCDFICKYELVYVKDYL